MICRFPRTDAKFDAFTRFDNRVVFIILSNRLFDAIGNVSPDK